MTTIVTFEGKQALAHAAADRFMKLSQTHIREKGRFNVVLTGGSTPRTFHEVLAGRDGIDWSRVDILWGDERCVPPDHEDSNYLMAKESLLDSISIPPENIYRMEGELPPKDAASRYEAQIDRYFNGALPTFDLLFLGMGEDGHMASLFPETAGLDETKRRVIANYVPKLSAWRITMTLPVINAAKEVIYLVSGDRKADALNAVINGPHQPRDYPAQSVQPENLFWYVDQAAARLL